MTLGQTAVYDDSVMRGFPPAPSDRVTPEQVYSDPRFTRWFMQHVREVERTAAVSSGGEPFVPLQNAPKYLDDADVLDANGSCTTLAELLERTFTDGILLLMGDRVLYERLARPR